MSGTSYTIGGSTAVLLRNHGMEGTTPSTGQTARDAEHAELHWLIDVYGKDPRHLVS